MSLLAPLLFRPVYKVVLWGGRRFERWRSDLPAGTVGESWDLADHDAGMSVVESGPLAGTTLRELVRAHPEELVGKGFRGQTFPVLVKLIDATDRLSVQVHPDDDLARSLGVGQNGKTECWLVLEDGGELYQGTRPGVDRPAFERALHDGRVAETLNHYRPHAGDFFMMKARTVHALGAGCMIYELQQTLDITFRVWDWGRVGADGKPRAMHVKEALETIDFQASGFGPQRQEWIDGRRTLVDGSYFALEEHHLLADPTVDAQALMTFTPAERPCSVVTCIAGSGRLATQGGEVVLVPGRTALVPAAAGGFSFTPASDSARPAHLLVATPKI
jgi:mannose-6-phosphate isomerase